MDVWSELTSSVAFLRQDDIDTDTIIPQVELITTGRTGLGKGLFANWRYEGRGEERRERPEFVLNRLPYRSTQIMAAGRNLGCGSSREHAAWALADFGIRCLLAPSYGSIFYRNCLRSRIAPLVVEASVLDELQAALGPACDARALTVDLTTGTLATAGRTWTVALDPAVAEYVVEGLDEVARTLRVESEIERYERAHRVAALEPR